MELTHLSCTPKNQHHTMGEGNWLSIFCYVFIRVHLTLNSGSCDLTVFALPRPSRGRYGLTYKCTLFTVICYSIFVSTVSVLTPGEDMTLAARLGDTTAFIFISGSIFTNFVKYFFGETTVTARIHTSPNSSTFDLNRFT